jgi:predicted dithiol-disulfide oxidoreductase (DUF899 family)
MRLSFGSARDRCQAFDARWKDGRPHRLRIPVKEKLRRGSADSFDADFGVDEWHGHNVFFRDGERVFRTYFINNRGDEAMGSTWSYLDLTPLGRQETWEDSPEGYPQSAPYKWWNWHDNYDAEASPNPKWVDIITDPQEAARKRDAEAKA